MEWKIVLVVFSSLFLFFCLLYNTFQSVVATITSIWLLPVYVTAKDSDKTTDIDDGFVTTTVGHVPSESPRLYATVLSAYIVFGYTMYQILLEFRWYIDMRHKFLRKPLPRHLTVFVRNIPLEFRNNQSLEAFFRSCFSDDAVLEARICLHAPNLTAIVTDRQVTVDNLEHAQALYQQNGIRPRHRNDLLLGALGESVDSIEYYTSLLQEQNREVTRRIDALERIVRGEDLPLVPHQGLEEEESPTTTPTMTLPLPLGNNNNNNESSRLLDTSQPAPPSLDQDQSNVNASCQVASMDELGGTTGATNASSTENTTNDDGPLLWQKLFQQTVQQAGNVANDTTNAVTDVAQRFVLGKEDGQVFPAAFVVFRKLSTVNAALQMIHHAEPFAIQVLEAPDPEDGMLIAQTSPQTQINLQKMKDPCISLYIYI